MLDTRNVGPARRIGPVEVAGGGDFDAGAGVRHPGKRRCLQVRLANLLHPVVADALLLPVAVPTAGIDGAHPVDAGTHPVVQGRQEALAVGVQQTPFVLDDRRPGIVMNADAGIALAAVADQHPDL